MIKKEIVRKKSMKKREGEGTKEQKREKQKHLAPASALTPNTLVPY